MVADELIRRSQAAMLFCHVALDLARGLTPLRAQVKAWEIVIGKLERDNWFWDRLCTYLDGHLYRVGGGRFQVHEWLAAFKRGEVLPLSDVVLASKVATWQEKHRDA